MATFSRGPSLHLGEGEREALFLALSDVISHIEDDSEVHALVAEQLRIKDAIATLVEFRQALRAGMSSRDIDEMTKERNAFYRREADFRRAIEAAE